MRVIRLDNSLCRAISRDESWLTWLAKASELLSVWSLIPKFFEPPNICNKKPYLLWTLYASIYKCTKHTHTHTHSTHFRLLMSCWQLLLLSVYRARQWFYLPSYRRLSEARYLFLQSVWRFCYPVLLCVVFPPVLWLQTWLLLAVTAVVPAVPLFLVASNVLGPLICGKNKNSL